MLFDCENFDSHNGYSDMARLIREADEACNTRDTAGCLDAIDCLYALFDAAWLRRRKPQCPLRVEWKTIRLR